MGDLVGAYSI